jgi:hypothetical protein
MEPLVEVRHEVADDVERLRYGLMGDGAQHLSYDRWGGAWQGDSPWRWDVSGEPPALVCGAVFEPLRALFEGPTRIALHGSAVVWRGTSVVLLGESGVGKSTTVVELMRRGGEVWSDDRTQLDGGQIMPEPVAGIRLWPQVGAPPGAVRWMPMPGRGAKRWWLLEGEARAPVPAEALVVLSPQEGAPEAGRMVRLHGMEAWRAVLGQTFDVSRPWAAWASRRLVQTRALVQRVGVWRLEYARSGDGEARHVEGLLGWLEQGR